MPPQSAPKLRAKPFFVRETDKPQALDLKPVFGHGVQFNAVKRYRRRCASSKEQYRESDHHPK